MVRPKRSALLLGRPISAALWNPAIRETPKNRRRLRGKSYYEVEFAITDTVRFLVARRGRGTAELLDLRTGDEAELTGPLGNHWADFLPDRGPMALISGGIGIAPLMAFASELEDRPFDFYAGFKTASLDDSRFRPRGKDPSPACILTMGIKARTLVLATEDGLEGNRGRIPDFLKPADYRAVFACGPEPMMRAVAASCKKEGVPCYLSLERHMACGVGACLGCTVGTAGGNRSVCADGPVFPAEDIYG
jgi:NAD(P)H-flavin reductase